MPEKLVMAVCITALSLTLINVKRASAPQVQSDFLIARAQAAAVLQKLKRFVPSQHEFTDPQSVDIAQ